MAKYQHLTESLIEDISEGRLKPGDRLVSLRRFARQRGVSVSTAVSTYQELERLGWVQARPQAGFYIAEQSTSVPEPEWPSFKAKIASPSKPDINMRSSDGPLGASCLELPSATQKAIEKSMRRVMNQATSRLNSYPHRQGEVAFRQALANHLCQRGYTTHSDELVITNGCIDAVRTALLVSTNLGDTVAVNSPCFNELLILLSSLKLKRVEIPSNASGVDIEQFESLVKNKHVQAGLFSTTHMNPQGITMSVEQKQKLAKLAAQYKTPIIEDDVYFELSHNACVSLPASFYDTSGYMIWCSSVSKSLSASLRVGWCNPGKYLTPFLKLCQGTPIHSQLMLADFIRFGAYAKHLKQTRYQLIENQSQYRNYLAKHLPAGSTITKPDGGLVLWMQIPGLDSKQLSVKAREANLDIRVGSEFTETQRYRDCVRINIGFNFTDKTKACLDQLIKLVS
jgi:DNA-binding transcriptional MocR family regulator